MKKTFVSDEPKISIKYDGTGDLLIFMVKAKIIKVNLILMIS